MDSQTIKLLIDLHKNNERQGPGGDEETKLAVRLAGLDPSHKLKIADIGCGTGASTLLLAKELNAEITAVDFLQEFLEILQERARNSNLENKITILNCSMDALPFTGEEFDVIWSEGAIYNMGFESGIKAWHSFLKPGGKLVVSEITWLTSDPPQEIKSYWDKAYPEIDTASAKMGILENNGYIPEGYFILPQHCWLENYYNPLKNSFDDFLERNKYSDKAKKIIEQEKEEIAVYNRFKEYYSYGVYVAGKK